MAHGLVRVDADHCFQVWLCGHDGVGQAAAKRLADEARAGQQPGIDLLAAWLAESDFGRAAVDVAAVLAAGIVRHARYAHPRTIAAITHLAGKYGIRPTQFVHAKTADLTMDGAAVVWHLAGQPPRSVTLDEDDMRMVRWLIEEGRGAGPRVGPNDPLLYGWTVNRVRMLLRRNNVASRSAVAALAAP